MACVCNQQKHARSLSFASCYTIMHMNVPVPEDPPDSSSSEDEDDDDGGNCDDMNEHARAAAGTVVRNRIINNCF